MNSEFFRQIGPRHTNPSLVSNHIHSTMVFPMSKYDHEYTQIKLNQRKDKKVQNSFNPQTIFQPKNEKIDYRYRRSKSNLSSYGTSSLGNLKTISDKDVFDNQKRDFDIINMDKKKYSDSIKQFPKYRLEIREDYPNKMRQAFIMGKPQIAIETNHRLKKSIITEYESAKK